MPAPPFLLELPLARIGPAWLSLTCCKGTAYVPLRLLSGQYPRARLGDVLPRLRCKACRKPPAGLALIDNPAGEAEGGPPLGWRIEL